MRKLKCLVMFLFVLVLAEICSAADQPRVIDLRPLGSAEPKITGLGYHGPAVVFFDNQTVGLSFYADNPSPGLSTRADPRDGKLLFESVILEVASGKILSKHIWENATRQSTMSALLDGNMLVRNSQEIAVF